MEPSRRSFQMARERVWWVVAIAVLGVVLTSCGAGDVAPDGQGPAAQEDATEIPTTDEEAAPAISKEEFLVQANEICVEAMAELDETLAEDNGMTREEHFLGEVIPSIRQQMQDFEELGFPEGDEDKIQQIIDDTEAILSELEANPDTLGSQPNPFSDVNEQMAEYGLDECV